MSSPSLQPWNKTAPGKNLLVLMRWCANIDGISCSVPVQCDFSWCILLPSMHITKQLPHVRTCRFCVSPAFSNLGCWAFSFCSLLWGQLIFPKNHISIFFLTFSSSFYFYSWNKFLSPPRYPCPSFSSLSHIEADWVWFVSQAGQTYKMNPLIFTSLQDLISSSLSSSGSFQRGLPMWNFTV